MTVQGRWCVYILRCGDGTLYTGATNDLQRRLERHAAGKGARYTRARLPVALAYREPAATRGAALRREAALKRLSRAEKVALLSTRPRAAPEKARGARRKARPRRGQSAAP